MPVRRFRKKSRRPAKGRGGNPNKNAPNPLRQDPSGTLMIRQKFSADLKRRVALLRKDLRTLIVDDDAFGLKEPNMGLVLHEASGQVFSLDEIVANTFNPDQPRDEQGRWTSGGRFRLPIDELEFPGGLGEEVTPLNDNRDKPIIVSETKTGWRIWDGWGRASGMRNAGAEEIHAILVTKRDLKNRRGAGDDPDWVASMYKKYAPNLDPPTTTNAFCPTGPGGGQDNSCSPHNSGKSVTDNPNFQKWFAGSKVVDEDGEPLRVYHGAKNIDFERFGVWESLAYYDLAGDSKVGKFYFSEDPEYASQYASEAFHPDRPSPAAGVKPVYLSIRNPLDIDAYTRGEIPDIGYNVESWAAHGYDGAFHTERGQTGKAWIAFYAEQIKSAIGNRGTFDPDEPIITHARQPVWNRQGKVVSSSDGRYAMLLDVPDVRQQDRFSCGAASSNSLGLWLGIGPKDLDEWKKKLGTNVEKSTSPQALIGYFSKLGARVEVKNGLSIDDLAAYLSKGWGVLCPYDDYHGRQEAKAEWDYGHWVLVVGRVPGYVVVQDPSMGNVMHRPGGDVPKSEEDKDTNLAAPGKKLIRDEDWLAHWRDVGEDGTEYVRYGIAVGPPLGSPIATFNAFCATGPGGGVDPTCSPKSSVAHIKQAIAKTDWKGLSAVSRKEVSDTLESLAKQYDLSQLTKIQIVPGHQPARMEGTRKVLEIPEDAGQAYGQAYGQSLADTVTHEVGHLLTPDFYNRDGSATKIGKRFEKWFNKNRGEIKRTISDYAASAKHEAVAEMFEKYERGIPNTLTIEGLSLLGIIKNDFDKLFPVSNSLRDEIDEAEKDADQNPTDEQAESGNYEKGHVRVQGLDITIETAAGGKRHGYKLQDTYGYIKGTQGKDKPDQIDVFLGPHPKSDRVFVVDQLKHPAFKVFDEHKCLVGWRNKKAAKKAYLRNFEDGWKGLGDITELSMDEFKAWLDRGDTTKPIAGQEIPTVNVFCATGEGGGVDPTCSPNAPGTVKDKPDARDVATPEEFEKYLRENADKWGLPGDKVEDEVWRYAHKGVKDRLETLEAAEYPTKLDRRPLDLSIKGSKETEQKRLLPTVHDLDDLRLGKVKIDPEDTLFVRHQTGRKWEKEFMEVGLDTRTAPPDSRLGRVTVGPEGGMRQSRIQEAGLFVEPATSDAYKYGVILQVKAKQLKMSLEAEGLHYKTALEGFYGAQDAIIAGEAIPPESVVGVYAWKDKPVWQPNPKNPNSGRLGTDENGRLVLKETTTNAFDPNQPRDEHGRWTNVFEVADFSYRDEDDDYLYHVTPAAEQIVKSGQIRSGRQSMDRGFYRDYSKGKVFFTERSAVKFWANRIEGHLGSQYEDPPSLKVVRVKKSDVVSQLSPDEVGTKDATGRKSYYSEKPVTFNAFCPTGPGGGQDNSCSPSGSRNTDSPAFKKWFGNSEVVDKDGKPLVVYHGTDADFEDVFDPEKGELGVHFGTRDVAEQVAEFPNPNGRQRIYPVYLSIKNPLTVQDPGQWDVNYLADQLVAKGGMTQAKKDAWLEGFHKRWKEHDWSKGPYPLNQEAWKLLEEHGYDGLRYYNRREVELPQDLRDSSAKLASLTDEEFLKRVPDASISWVAFKPTQIKSAIGSKGSFDPSDPIITHSREPVSNERFMFNTTHEKVEAFRLWLKRMVALHIVKLEGAKDEDYWWKKYTEWGFRNGAGRAFDSAKKPYAKGYAEGVEGTRYEPGGSYRTAAGGRAREDWDFSEGVGKADWTKENKDEFLRSSFARPVSVAKVKLLAGRTYTDIVGVTERMSSTVMRTLTDGLVKGESPRTIAEDLDGVLDAYEGQALNVARTECIRASNEGNLDMLENLGVEEVGVAVEWSTSGIYGLTAAGYESPCPLCQELEGVVLKLDEARGLLPRHPGCMCSWTIAGVGESDKGQIDTRKDIMAAIDASIEAEIPKRSKRTLAQQRKRTSWQGADAEIDSDRPQSILDNRLIAANRLWYKQNRR